MSSLRLNAHTVTHPPDSHNTSNTLANTRLLHRPLLPVRPKQICGIHVGFPKFHCDLCESESLLFGAARHNVQSLGRRRNQWANLLFPNLAERVVLQSINVRDMDEPCESLTVVIPDTNQVIGCER